MVLNLVAPGALGALGAAAATGQAPLTSCCTARFPTGQGLEPVCRLKVGDPRAGTRAKQWRTGMEAPAPTLAKGDAPIPCPAGGRDLGRGRTGRRQHGPGLRGAGL